LVLYGILQINILWSRNVMTQGVLPAANKK